MTRSDIWLTPDPQHKWSRRSQINTCVSLTVMQCYMDEL